METMRTEERLYRAVYTAVRRMNVELPEDVRRSVLAARRTETGSGRKVLERIEENLEIARERTLPMCQDTGMVVCFAEQGDGFPLGPFAVRAVVERAVADAYRDGYFRKSVVLDPLYDRTNTGTNLPTVYHFEPAAGDGCTVRLAAKGFGSENCSRLFMLKPTDGEDEVIAAVARAAAEAGGAPCPPVVIGIGLGGTMDKAAVLSKKALFREIDDAHPDPRYARLEEKLLEAVNAAGIGPGGLGGRVSALAVKVEPYPTHIAGLPLAVTINCWADRKAVVVMNRSES